MGFLSSLGKTITNAAKEELRGGVVNGLLKGLGLDSQLGPTKYNVNTNIYNTQNSDNKNETTYYSASMGLSQLEGRRTKGDNDITTTNKYNKNGAPSKMTFTGNDVDEVLGRGAKFGFDSDVSKVKLPSWGYEDFINERAIWQKQIGGALNDPAWFYFKIFFDFDTNHGLFGSLINKSNFKVGENTAAKYLYFCKSMYKDEDTESRISALYKFTSILSYICANAPWFFKSIKGVDKLSVPILNDFSKERSIEIELMPDAIDMRLTTLMSLYKYACYDDYNHKEVIPENLRQFNMSIVVFQAPLRYLHTSYMTNQKKDFMGINLNGIAGGLGGALINTISNKKVNYKQIGAVDMKDRMSFKIYTLYGCEFDMESFASIMPGEMTNESPFQLGNNALKIKYSSCIEHTMNEFYQIMYGSNGFFFNNYANYQDDHTYTGSKYSNAIKAQNERYQSLADTLEGGSGGNSILGIMKSPTSYKRAIDATEALMNGMFDNNDLLGDIGTNYVLGLLGSSKNSDSPQGNLYGDYGIGSAYFKDKLEMLKKGVHENTMPPYHYDAQGNPIYERGRPANEYSAYDWYQTKNNISNFTYDIGSYIKQGASKLGSNTNDNIRKLVQSGYSSLYTDNIPSGNTRKPYDYSVENPNADESWRVTPKET